MKKQKLIVKPELIKKYPVITLKASDCSDNLSIKLQKDEMIITATIDHCGNTFALKYDTIKKYLQK